MNPSENGTGPVMDPRWAELSDRLDRIEKSHIESGWVKEKSSWSHTLLSKGTTYRIFYISTEGNLIGRETTDISTDEY